ncbi:MAG: hypothetical protein HOG19_11840 [Gammaproteobacteria bacterium]|nr:hypothetical protein [Gammaproteobacteria bacterium]
MPQPAQPQMTPEQYAALVSQASQAPSQPQFNLSDYARSKGIDVSQFEGGEPAFADALLRAAQGYMTNQAQLTDTQQQLQAAQVAAQNYQELESPKIPNGAPDVSRWEHLLVEDNGRVQPKAGAPVPWNVVEAAQTQMDTRRKNMQAILTDPQSVIREHVGGDWLEEQFKDRFEKAWAERQREEEVERWLQYNDRVVYSGEGDNKALTPEGKRLSAIVDEYRERGIKSEYVFQMATRDLERELLQESIEHTAQQTYERNQQYQYQQYQQQQAALQSQQQFQVPQGYGQNQYAAQQSAPVQQYTQPPQQPSYLDRNVGNQGASAPGSAFTTTSRDSGPETTGAAVNAADFVAEDPESIARSVAIESGAMNASGELN